MSFDFSSTLLDPQGLLYFSARYIESLRIRNYSERTLEERTLHLNYFREFCQQLGLSQAREVSRAVILNYQSYLFHYRKADAQPLTIESQTHRLGHVIHFFSYLTREGLIPYNPASDILMPRASVRLPKVILNATEVERVMNVPDVQTAVGMRDRAILEVLYSSGIRRAELCRLDTLHVDFERQLMRIEQGKGKKDRYVPIGQRALGWMEKYLVEVRPQFCPSLHEAALFLSVHGTRLSIHTLAATVHNLISQSGIGKKGGCHLFRHTFATLLLENGCDIRYIQAMLGHSSLEATQIYTHVAIKELQQAHRRFHPARMPEA